MDSFSRSLAAAALIDGQHFTLTGFGTIEGVYVSARINHSERRVEAPRLEVKWSDEVDPTAQTFSQFLESTGATSFEANDIEGNWLDALTTGESIVIGDLGTLVPDPSTGLCSFEANTDALAGAFSGNNAVTLEPISKRALPDTPVAPVVEIDTKKDNSASAKTKERSLVSRLVPYASAAAAVLLLIVAINFFTKEAPVNDDSRGKVVTVNQERLNRSPREEATTADLPIEQIEEGPFDEASTSAPEGFDNSLSIEEDASDDLGDAIAGVINDMPVDFESASPSRVGDEAQEEVPAFDPAALAGGLNDDNLFAISEIDVVIVLGSFTNSANAARLTEKVAEAGLIPYVDQPGAFTRVGATFAVSSEAEVEQLKHQMRKQFSTSAWVLE